MIIWDYNQVQPTIRANRNRHDPFRREAVTRFHSVTHLQPVEPVTSQAKRMSNDQNNPQESHQILN